MTMQANDPRRKLLIASVSGAAGLMVIGALLGDLAVFGNLLVLAIFAAIIPIVIYNYSRYLWLKAIEEHFPDFIRDMADSQRSGMSFPESIALAAKANYGKLTPLVQSMHNRLTWGTSFIRVLDIFSGQLKKSRVISEALLILRESYQSGGNVAATLEAVSRDMVTLKETESERSNLVHGQVMIMYGIFFMFVGIAVMVIYVMVPLIKATPALASAGSVSGTSGIGFSFSDPCAGFGGFPCNYFGFVGIIFGLVPGLAQYYITMFFTVVLIQAICTGLIAGQIGQNSITAGSKHMILMVVASFSIFLFLAKAHILPV